MGKKKTVFLVGEGGEGKPSSKGKSKEKEEGKSCSRPSTATGFSKRGGSTTEKGGKRTTYVSTNLMN